MKSKLSQYFSLATIFTSGSDVIKSLELVAEDHDDTAKLIKFMMED